MACPLINPQCPMPWRLSVSAPRAEQETRVVPSVDAEFDFTCLRSLSPVNTETPDPMLLEATLCTPGMAGLPIAPEYVTPALSIDLCPYAAGSTHRHPWGSARRALNDVEFELLSGLAPQCRHGPSPGPELTGLEYDGLVADGPACGLEADLGLANSADLGPPLDPPITSSPSMQATPANCSMPPGSAHAASIGATATLPAMTFADSLRMSLDDLILQTPPRARTSRVPDED